MRSSRLFSQIVIATAVLFIPSVACSQVPDPVAAAQVPIPGVGHHYIGIGAETVSPADGSLSFDLPLQPPPGRQLSFPFGIHYNASERFSPSGTGPNVLWVPFPAPPFQLNGWNYQLPVYTAEVYQAFGGLTPQQQTLYCDHTHNYVFRGFDGIQRNLGLNANWPDGGTNQYNCSVSTNSGTSVDGFVSGMTGNTWPTHPPLTVTDPSGTNYQFPSVGLAPSGTNTPWGLMAQTITDKNGNQITFTGTSNSGTNGGYKDTLSRTVVSWTGIGSSSGDQLTMAGLGGNVVVRWTQITESFPESGRDVSDNGVAGPCSMTPNATSPQQISAVSEIDIPGTPSSTKYVFFYDSVYARPNKVTFPGGGYVRYVWGLNTSSATSVEQWPAGQGTAVCTLLHDTAAITDRFVSYDGISEVLHQRFSFTTNWDSANPANWLTKRTTVTNTDLLTGQVTITTYNYVPGIEVGSGQVPVEQQIVYQNGSGTTLKTVNKTWSDVFHLIGEQTILDNGQGSATLRCYNGSGQQVSDIYEYGFQSEGSKPPDPSCPTYAGALSAGLNISAIGPLRRHTGIAYHTFANTHIVNEPDSITVYDGSGNQVKQSAFAYDGSGVVSSGAANLVTPSGLRGNLTSATRWLSIGTSPTTTYAYYDTGQVQSMTDPCGNTTCSDMTGTNHTITYSYADSYASCGGAAPPAGATNAYLTQITDPLGHTQKFCYGYTDGQLRGSTDPNGQTITYKYNDVLVRLTETDYPDGGKTTLTYNDSTYNTSTPSPSLTTTKLITTTPSSVNLVTTTAMDGLGHVVKTLLTTDPDCPSNDKTDTTYDGFGRVLTVSNTYCTTSDTNPPYGITTYAYDALGRTTKVTHPDNSTLVTNFTGRATQVQDEGNGTQSVARISQSDGLGRLVSVCEVAPGPFIGAGGASSSSLIGSGGTPANCGLDLPGTGFLTTYQYDALDNLLQVNQSGVSARLFFYDSLSRLRQTANPETGQLCYGNYATGTCQNGYDANGNLISRIDSRGIQTTFAYDALNRVTQKSYSDGVTPTATFTYDTSSIGGQNYPGNPIGRLVATSTTSCTETIYEHDPMGRVKYELQMTPLSCDPGRATWLPYQVDYTYDLMGNMTSHGDGYFHTYTHTYNSAARLTAITSSLDDGGIHFPGTLLSTAHYDAAGHLTSDTLGDGETETFSYNKRGWQQSTSAILNSATLYSFNITSFAPNGDVLAENDSVNGNWTYSYDPFNRLIGANQNSGQAVYNYVYDRFGNRWQQNGPRTFVATFTGNNPGSPANNNRIDGYTYDAAGNLLNDGTHSYIYDAENRLIQVDAGNTAKYIYNAEGNRVRRTGVLNDTCDGTGIRDYVYDLSGRWVLEVNFGGTACNYEIYAGSRHLGSYRGDTLFSHTDWLGTERASESYYYRNQYPPKTCTNLPFGDGFTCSDLGTSTLHFTGKERDPESGLDDFGARYFGSSLGRFMSPDPKQVSAHLSDPQSFNRYVYARNNPLLYVDPDGRDFGKAWNDAKTFVQSFYIKVSGCICLEAKAKLGVYEGKFGAAAKASVQTSTSPDAPALTISRSADAGATVGPTNTSGMKLGEGASVDQTLVKVNSFTSADARTEVPTTEITDTIGGHTTPNAPDDKVGIGVGIGVIFGVEGEVGNTKEGLSALRDIPGQIKESLQNPTPPAPKPPSPPPTCAGDQKKPCQ